MRVRVSFFNIYISFVSKETLKELLMSSLMLVPEDQSTISECFRNILSEFECQTYIHIYVRE